MLRVTAREFEQGYRASTSDAPYQADGAYLFNCNFYDSNVTHLFAAKSATGLAIVDSTFDLSGNHLLYTSSAHSLIYNNTLSRPAFGRTAYRLSGNKYTTPNEFTWISDNTMTGWIDPRLQEFFGSEFSTTGDRWNYSLVNMSPNNNSYGADTKGLRYCVMTNNGITGYENALNLGALESCKITDNTFETASIAAGLSRIDVSTDTSTRPANGVLIDGNTFTETADRDGYMALISLDNYAEQECSDLPDGHTGVEITNNTFNIIGADYKMFSMEGIDTLSSGLLTLDQAETALIPMVTITGNIVNTPNILAPLLCITEDFIVSNQSTCSTFDPYCTGDNYRMYNTTSSFYTTIMGDTVINQV